VPPTFIRFTISVRIEDASNLVRTQSTDQDNIVGTPLTTAYFGKSNINFGSRRLPQKCLCITLWKLQNLPRRIIQAVVPEICANELTKMMKITTASLHHRN
jgi:hypothetical protein